MSKRTVLFERDCDYSINTAVNLGNKIKDVPQGWALNLQDIREFIPVLRYELECYIQINGIFSPCKIRINPRLFYSGVPLRDHLREQKNIDADKKIPLEIKFNKAKLDKLLDDFDVEPLDYIDTKLLVGKSFSSKGWTLSKDVVSKIVPLNAYNYMFPVYIDGIPAETRLNLQTRLFYNGQELSNELKRLYGIDPKKKVDARIILNERFLQISKSVIDEHLSSRKCIKCGNFVDEDNKNDKCFVCMDKEITVLKLNKILDYFKPSDTFFEEDLLNLGFMKGQIKIMLNKFEKYGLISINWDGSLQLMDQFTINSFIKQWG